ncbi:ribosomal large subunit pseudouridine synthase D [Anaerobacterium chartisolvens]|uniref:RNA pseudouridylate synthase n=1 Tax=Anaerobacterium chartisolvens TaxID=1297424 RepID=A0A369B7V8_9FIRM|nr:RluA family pseudouridine synthase [Anaerobacterium chartisolvens]RCX17612.1 ribosomal large subunit pseudouridine synthase D [Anaerobacterium chartisolvens]
MAGKTPEIRILYEDNHLLAVEKPVNVLSQSDSTGDADMLSLLKEYIRVKYGKPGDVYLGLVHRLDRPVGGVMVFARTSKAASRLSEQIRRREFKKTYMAVVHGSFSSGTGTLRHWLKKDEAENTVRVVSAETEGAKEAVLDYYVLGSRDGVSLVKIDLHTGRSHQIRVQFSQEGHALFGDQKYGRGLNKAGQQIALWSLAIELLHPTLKQPLELKCTPPNIFPWSLF